MFIFCINKFYIKFKFPYGEDVNSVILGAPTPKMYSGGYNIIP